MKRRERRRRTKAGPPKPAKIPAPEGLEAAVAAHRAGRLQEALRLYGRFLASRPADTGALNLAAIASLQSGADGRAVDLLEAALAVNGDDADTHRNLGTALSRVGRLDDAAAAYRRALELAPGDAEAREGLEGVAGVLAESDEALARAAELQRAGRVDQALRLYREILAARPAHVDALNLCGVALVQTDQATEALPLLRRAAAAAGDRADVHYNLGGALRALGRFADAAAAYGRALAIDPEDPQSLNNLGVVLSELDEYESAEVALRNAVAIDGDYAEAHNNLGAVLTELGRPEEAMTAVNRAFELRPDFAGAHNNLGRALRDSGRIDEAAAAFFRAIASEPDRGEAYGNLYGLKTVAARREDIVAMSDLLTRTSVTDREATVLCFALASAHEGLGDHDVAFGFLERANQLKRASITYDGDAREAMIRQIMNVFDRDLLARHAGRGCSSRAPIFVVGMPRSGTSLVEQILASHSQVAGGGELKVLPSLVDELDGRTRTRFPDVVVDLTPQETLHLGESYLAEAARQVPHRPRFTDKLPDNFLHLGLLHLVLPGATIVHCIRDPVDTCVSCFKVNFATGMGFAYDLRELGRHYRLYDALMGHWRAILPGRFLDVPYETLVSSPEAEIRKLLEFCDLAWEDGCLGFHNTARAVRTASAAQIRQPIYTSSVGRWKRYERHLAPLLEALGHGPTRAPRGVAVVQQ